MNASQRSNIAISVFSVTKWKLVVKMYDTWGSCEGKRKVTFNLLFIWFSFTTASRLTLYILTSVWIFSILFSVHLLKCWEGEFAEQSRASHNSWSFHLFLWLSSLIRGWYHEEKFKLVTLWGQMLNITTGYMYQH